MPSAACWDLFNVLSLCFLIEVFEERRKMIKWLTLRSRGILCMRVVPWVSDVDFHESQPLVF